MRRLLCGVVFGISGMVASACVFAVLFAVGLWKLVQNQGVWTIPEWLQCVLSPWVQGIVWAIAGYTLACPERLASYAFWVALVIAGMKLCGAIWLPLVTTDGRIDQAIGGIMFAVLLIFANRFDPLRVRSKDGTQTQKAAGKRA